MDKGFTRDIAKYLEIDYPEKDRGELIMLAKDMFYNRTLFTEPSISTKQFINCCKMIPKYNFKSGKPFSLRKYLWIARLYPEVLFEGYIITEGRPDERLDIDAVYIPRKNWRYKLLIKLLEKWLPDENNHHMYYTRLWWD